MNKRCSFTKRSLHKLQGRTLLKFQSIKSDNNMITTGVRMSNFKRSRFSRFAFLAKTCATFAVLSVSMSFMAQSNENEPLNSKSFCEKRNIVNDCFFEQIYIRGALGLSVRDFDNTDVQVQAEQLGYEVFDIDTDDKDSGFKIIAGAALSSNWSLEFGFIDLGRAEAEFSSLTAMPVEFYEQARGIYPASAAALTLAANYSFFKSENWYMHANLGLAHWQADFDSRKVFEDQDLPSLPRQQGNDVFFGLGINYLLSENTQIGLEAERYKILDENVDLYSIGMSYYF